MGFKIDRNITLRFPSAIAGAILRWVGEIMLCLERELNGNDTGKLG